MLDNNGSSDITQRRIYARQVMSNPTGHFRYDQPIDHPEVRYEWIEETIIEPYHQETDTDGSELYYGSVPGYRKWLKVVVLNDQIHGGYFDRRITRMLGAPT